MRVPQSRDNLKQAIQEFSRSASVEISAVDEGLLPALVQRLPVGTTIYIAARTGATLEDVVRVACSAQAQGFRASPHLIARRLPSERALRDALRELAEGGVQQVMVVAGEERASAGKFSNTMEVLETGATVDAGIRTVAVAGYPEGHMVVGPSRLLQALKDKQAFAEATGTRVHIVTQFGFNATALCAWALSLERAGVSLPIHAGIAGPMPLPQLIQLAMRHSPRGSLASLMTHLTALSHRAKPTTAPDEVLTTLVRACCLQGPNRIERTHFYSFGGAVATATWLRRVMDGVFHLSEAANSFSVA